MSKTFYYQEGQTNITAIFEDKELVYYNQEEGPCKGSYYITNVNGKEDRLDCYKVNLPEKEALLPQKKTLKHTDTKLVKLDHKEFSTKLARVSEKFTILGRFIILDPFSIGLKFSSQFNKDAKEKFTSSFNSCKYAIIFRSRASFCDTEEILNEYRKLEKFFDNLVGEKNQLPIPRLVKNGYDDLLEKLYLEDNFSLVTNSYELRDLVTLDKNSTIKLDSFLDILKNEDISLVDIDFKNRVFSDKSGINIVVDKLEALTVIDVNSGRYNFGKDKKSNATSVNNIVADLIARQIMLNKLSGIILVDFLRTDYKSQRNLLDLFISKANKYYIKIKEVSITKSGLFEIVVYR